MKTSLLVVVQRYGLEIVGGAETLARNVTEHLAPHFDIEVATTCAQDYWTWANHYPPGDTTVRGVTVHRFPTVRERSRDFASSSRRVLQEAHDLADETRWILDQGPDAPALLEWIHREGPRFDAALFVGYLYAPTLLGLPLLHDRAILMPAAHDEPAIRLSSYRALFHLPRAFSFSTLEEQELVHRLFPATRTVPADVIGSGLDVPAGPPDPDRFRREHGITRPFVLSFGRLSEAKGADVLLDHWCRFKDAPGSPNWDLVLAGQAEVTIPKRDDVHYLGFVDDRTKWDMLAASSAHVLPSQYESLSIVVMESWWCGKPALVRTACLPVAGQVRRAAGGITYEGYPEFAEALALLARDAALRDRLGAGGHAYVEANYAWPVIVDKYLDLFAELRIGR